MSSISPLLGSLLAPQGQGAPAAAAPAGGSPFGAASPVFPNGMGQGASPASSTPGINPDTQKALSGTQNLTSQMNSLADGIANGSISGKAPGGDSAAGGLPGGLPGGSSAGGGLPGGGLPGGSAIPGDKDPLHQAAGGSAAAPGGGITGDIKTPAAGSYGGVKLSDEQAKNAAIIASVGKKMGMSKKDIQVAIATAMQESQLKNINYGDRDSLGLFQQRANWGSAQERTNPEAAATKFFEKLKAKPNRESQSVAKLAQSVQISAFPDAYAKWESMAGELVSKMG